MKGIWLPSIQAWRDQHLRSEGHRQILKVVEIEIAIQERFGISADHDNVPQSIKKLAFLMLADSVAETEELREKLARAMDTCVTEYRTEVN